MNQGNWVHLCTFHDRFQAELFKAMLEAHGLTAELFQEAVGHHIYPTMINGLAETHFFVPPQDLAAAQDLLAVFQSAPEEPADDH